jgi:hypothetical protein
MVTDKIHFEEHTVNQITRVVYFCGKCNKICGHDFFCKSCKHQYLFEDLKNE